MVGSIGKNMIFTAHDAYEMTLKEDVLQMDVELLYPIFEVIKQCCRQGDFDCFLSLLDKNVKEIEYIVGRLKFFGYEVELFDKAIDIKWRR